MRSHGRGRVGIVIPAVAFLIALSARADDWPQWLGPQRDSIWRETGIIEKFPADGPPVKWRRPIGSGYSGPSVANGRVYVMDRQLSTDANSPTNPMTRGTIPGSERVLCLNEATGEIVWHKDYDCPYTVSYAAGPRTTPLVSGGKVYTLGTEGNLYCLDATKGDVIWKHDFKKDYDIATPMWGFSAHPLLDGQRLICLAGGSNTTVVAFDKDTGKELWHALTAKEPGYAPPTLIKAGGKPQLISWNPESVNSLNPETGEVYWTQPWKIQYGMSIATPRQAGDELFFSCFYSGAMMFKLDTKKTAATVIWQSKKASEKDTDKLNSTMSTPFIEDGYIYGVCSYGQFRCLKADTGERIWEAMAVVAPDGKEVRWGNAFIVKNGNRFFLFNEKGDLIIAKLSPKGYEEISRAHILEPANRDPGREVVWSHPAFANRHAYARNDKEIICVDLAK